MWRTGKIILPDPTEFGLPMTRRNRKKGKRRRGKREGGGGEELGQAKEEELIVWARKVRGRG